jgi:hypothetical protein
MIVEYKGSKIESTKIQELINLLDGVTDSQSWNYMGLKVEIDPTVDYNNENVLVRWFDIKEGFNDKIIVNSLREFNSHFKPIN